MSSPNASGNTVNAMTKRTPAGRKGASALFAPDQDLTEDQGSHPEAKGVKRRPPVREAEIVQAHHLGGLPCAQGNKQRCGSPDQRPAPALAPVRDVVMGDDVEMMVARHAFARCCLLCGQSPVRGVNWGEWWVHSPLCRLTVPGWPCKGRSGCRDRSDR